MSEKSKRKDARAMLARSGYKAGGHVKAKKVEAAEEPDEPGDNKAPVRLRDGGLALGGAAAPRSDRKSRGKHMKGKGHTTVNVVVAGHQEPKPVPVPVPKPVPIPINAGGPPPGGPGGPGPMPPDGPGPGGPPPGLKRGGRAKVDSQRDAVKGMPAGQFKKGGRTKGYPIDDGAGGGAARLEKRKAYGA